MRWISANVIVFASLLTSSVGAQQPPAAPPPERFRRAIVLLRSGHVFEAPFHEGGRHFRLRFPEGTLDLPLDDLRQVFFYAKEPQDPQGFVAALGSIDGLERFLARQPEPLAHGLLLRALLRADGRASAEAYVATHDLTWLLGLVRKGAAGTDEARRAADALARSRLSHGLVTLPDGFQLEADYRRRSDGAVVLTVPEGRLDFAASDQVVVQPSAAIGMEKDGELERALTEALADPEALARHLHALPAAQASAALLRALLRGERTAAVAMRSGAEQLGPLLRWVVRSATAPGPAELAAAQLARSGELAELEHVLVAALRSDQAWRRRLGQRGLATIMAAVPDQAGREVLLANWEQALESDDRAVAALRLTVGLGDRASALLAAQGDQVPDVLRLLAEARCAFDASGAAAIAVATDSPAETRLLALCAIGVSRDVRQVELLIGALARAERDGSPSDGPLVRQLDRTLTMLLAAPRAEGPRAASDWAELWATQLTPLAVAEEALGAAGDPLRPVEERLAAWDRVVALPFLTVNGARAASRALREATDPDLLASVLGLLAKFGVSSSDLMSPAVQLLEDPRLGDRARASVHAGLTRIHGAALPARVDAWAELVARHAYAPPFGPVLPPVIVGEE